MGSRRISAGASAKKPRVSNKLCGTRGKVPGNRDPIRGNHGPVYRAAVRMDNAVRADDATKIELTRQTRDHGSLVPAPQIRERWNPKRHISQRTI